MLDRPFAGEVGIRKVLLEDAAELGVNTGLPVSCGLRLLDPKMEFMPAAAGVEG